MAHKDMLGQELMRGDLVLTTSSEYKELIKGKVLDFTPKMVKVELEKAKRHPWQKEYVLRTPDQVVKYGHQP